MNARHAGEVAAACKAGFGSVEIVGPAAEAAAPHSQSVSIGPRVVRPSRMWASHRKPKILLGTVVAVLAPSVVSAEESASGAGFFWVAVLVLAGPALGGLAVCAAMIGWRWTTSRMPWAIGLMASRRWSSRPKIFARADIASVLVPLIDHAGFRGSGTIQIVGSDGGYLTGAKKKELTDAIRKWVEAMWIEGNHPAGEDVSYNNQWVPPAAMSQAVADLPNQTWSDVFSAWDGKLRRLCEYSRERTPIQ